MRMLDAKGSLESEVLSWTLFVERVQRWKGVPVVSHRRVLRIEEAENRETVLKRMLDETAEHSLKTTTVFKHEVGCLVSF